MSVRRNMPRGFDAARFERELRAAQRKAEAEARRRVQAYNTEVDRVNKENQRRYEAAVREEQRKIDAHNRKVEQQYKRDVEAHNRHVRSVNDYNRKVVEANRRRPRALPQPRYTTSEQTLAARVQEAAALYEGREWDTFLSYAHLDGAKLAAELREELESLGVTAWHDVDLRPGKEPVAANGHRPAEDPYRDCDSDAGLHRRPLLD